ncbi:N-acetylhexosamine 1-kinase [Lachnospiraceae bacterium KM106-2]|nr:N-acetylhexosamine 1-kinase [Lachnospiraceae bacterium KM106-2]
MLEIEEIKGILQQFELRGEVIKSELYGEGHINETYLVVLQDDQGRIEKYILQKMNDVMSVGTKDLMRNMERVIAHLEQKRSEGYIESGRPLLKLIRTVHGDPFYCSKEQESYRVFEYMIGVKAYTTAQSKQHVYECGKQVGQFIKLMSDYSFEQCYLDRVGFFHDTRKRYDDFIDAVTRDSVKRAHLLQEEILFAKERREELFAFMQKVEKGVLPLRATHNDTKLSNIMIEANTKKAVALIDYDTIMPGSSVMDFGDLVRSAAVDPIERNKVDLSLFYWVTKGFLEEAAHYLTEGEVSNLLMGAKMVTMECGIRYFTDFLKGDIYFKTRKWDDNYKKGQRYFSLVMDMEKKWEQMNQMICSLDKENL